MVEKTKFLFLALLVWVWGFNFNPQPQPKGRNSKVEQGWEQHTQFSIHIGIEEEGKKGSKMGHIKIENTGFDIKIN